MDMRKYDLGREYPVRTWMRRERFHRWFWPILALVEALIIVAGIVVIVLMAFEGGKPI